MFVCGFLNLESVLSVSAQNILLSSNDLEDLLGDPKDESFLSFGRTVSRIFKSLNIAVFFKAVLKIPSSFRC